MSRVAAPTRPIVPGNRPVAPPIPGKANPQVAAAAPVKAPVATATSSATPAAATPADATAAQPKKRGRKAGSTNGKPGKARLPEYHGLYEFGTDGNAVQIDSGKKDEAGNAIMVYKRQLLIAIPTDYDPAKHAKLKSSDFTDEAMFLDWRAGALETMAQRMRKRAENLRKIVNVEDRKRANKLQKMREEMEKLSAILKSQNVDVDALFANTIE